MSVVNYSIPSALTVNGVITISGTAISPTGTNRLKIGSDFTLVGADSGNFTPVGLITGLSGALVDQIMAAAGVLALNAATGLVTIASAGTNVFVSNSGTTIYISGSGIAQSFDLTASGIALMARDTAISGGLQAQIAQSGQQAWISANGAAATLSGNLTQTGVQLRVQIASLSGLAIQSGNARSYMGAVAIGLDFLSVTFSPAFPGVPAIIPALQATGSVGYTAWPSGVTANGYTALFSATTTENLILHTNAFYNV